MRYAIVRALVVVAIAACTVSQPAPVARPVVAPTAVAIAAAAVPDTAPVADTIVVEASGLASRTVASKRALRRIVAARRGLVELVNDYTEISLMVTKVVSGSLDPDYARRPVGANRLSVILLDEAAFAAPAEMEGFSGTWKLTRLADGSLVVSAIEDTPWAADLVAGRRALIAKARRDLRSQLPEQRLAGLEFTSQHLIYDLVPDVIALLPDKRVHEHLRVGEVAGGQLSAFARPIVDAATGLRGRTPDDWTDWWRARTATPELAMPVTQTTATELARLPAYQSWPEFARTPHGTVLAVSRLEAPLDGTSDGVFVLDANGKRSWLSRIVPEAVDVAIGPTTTAVLYAEPNASWRVKLLDGGKPRSGALAGAIAHAAYNVLTLADDGYVVFGVAPNTLLAIALDAKGTPRSSTKKLALPAAPDAQYHRGIQPLSVARHARGWYVVVATRGGIVGVDVDKQLAATSATISAKTGIIQPKVAVAGDHAFVAWASDRGWQLESTLVDLRDNTNVPNVAVGTEVMRLSQAVALDDGFAIAWIEAGGEVHIGRWNRDGTAISNIVVVRRGATPFHLELTREGAALVVTYLDDTRYPYTVISRRL